MKKTLLALLAITTCSIHAFAVEHIITFPGFAYSPNALTVEVGDIVTWEGDFSFHPLESVSVPQGADSFFNNTGNTFSYNIAIPGTYTFHCTLHSVMTGTITASASVGIAQVENNNTFFSIENQNGRVCIKHNATASQPYTTATLYTADGKLVWSKQLASIAVEQWIELPESNQQLFLLTLQNGTASKTLKLQ